MEVLGFDLSANMVSIALERANEIKDSRVTNSRESYIHHEGGSRLVVADMRPNFSFKKNIPLKICKAL